MANGYSRLVIVGALVAIVAFALAAILFLGTSDAASERLGLFFGLVGTVVVALIGALRADVSAHQSQANGEALNGQGSILQAAARAAGVVAGSQGEVPPANPPDLLGPPAKTKG